MAAIASRTTPFERTMDSLDLPKSDVNNLIMDYLITEGYPSAARKFAIEANIKPNQDDTSITERVNIRDLIHQGELQQAIEAINELDVALLDSNKKLHFSLLRLQLIEMIKQSFVHNDTAKIGAALEFATNNLSPYTLGDEQFRIDLERAMALLIVPKDIWMNPQASGGFGSLAELVHPDLRRKTARDVNEAILKSKGLHQEANINYLVKARAWSENQAREKKVALPEKLDLGLSTNDGPSQSSNGQNDSGDTEMSENSAGTDSDLMRYTNISS